MWGVLKYVGLCKTYQFTDSVPLNLCKKHIDIMASFLPALKYRFTLVKEEDSIIDLCLSKYEFEILTSTHASQRWEVYQ